MSIEIPTISISGQDDTNENQNDENDYDCDIRNVHTDVEDFDSHDEDLKYTNLTKTLQNLSIKKSSPAVTDIEDYYDSDMEEEKNSSILELQISLNEYLDPGFTEEEVQLSNQITSKSGTKIIEGNFSNHLSVELDDPGCITDCENIDTSDDEGGNYLELIKNNDKVKKKALELFDHMYTSNEIIREISSVPNYQDDEGKEKESKEEGACCLSSAASEAEGITTSEDGFEIDEDENQNHKCNYPIIDITFIPDHKSGGRRKLSDRSSTHSPYLDASENIEDSLTDIEKFESSGDSSNESDVSSSNPIPRARASISSITDIEDMDISNGIDLFAEMKQINDKDLPAVVREMVIVKEDDCGDPVAKIVPLTEDIHYLNIDTFTTDKGLTDIEEISDVDCDYYELVDSPTVEIPIIENAVVQNCENIKPQYVKKIECIDREPVTETEEFFEAGTVRRKRTKTKTQGNKQKSKFLDVIQSAEQAVTDIEEIEVSDFELHKNSAIGQEQKGKMISGLSTPEQVTDLEYVTGEEDNCMSDVEQKSEGIISKQEHFHSSVSTIEALLHQQGDKIHRKPTPIARGRIFESEPNSLCTTDIEDIQLPSDTDENLFNGSYSRAETISPIEIQEVLNDSVSVVYEKCSNLFNVDKEKNFIKGMKDCNETNTDVEYLDEEIAAGGEEKINYFTINLNKGEEAPTERKPDDKKK